MSNIAIAAQASLTFGGKAIPSPDDQLLQAELKNRGHRVEIINWENVRTNPLQFDSIFISSTWNACLYPQEFLAWLSSCEQDGQRRLINDHAVLEAGFFKDRYWHRLEQILKNAPSLQDLAELTPSRFFLEGAVTLGEGVEALDSRRLAEILAELDETPEWAQSNIVFKPVVSADGRDTFVYNRFKRTIPIDEEKRAKFVLESAQEAEVEFRRLAKNTVRRGVLLQPYIEGVESGEYSLTILGGQCTHAIQKPKLFKGDGSIRRKVVELDKLPRNMQRFAEALVQTLDTHFGSGSISRARVDLFDRQGIPVLCELECVEPNTNINIVAKHNESIAKKIVQHYADVIENQH